MCAFIVVAARSNQTLQFDINFKPLFFFNQVAFVLGSSLTLVANVEDADEDTDEDTNDDTDDDTDDDAGDDTYDGGRGNLYQAII